MSFNDSFDRANNTSLGAVYTVVPSSGGISPQIVSNRVRSNNTSNAGNWVYTTGTYANDQADSITLIVNVTGNDDYGGPMVRVSTSAFTAYYGFGHISGGYELTKVVAGSFTGLASDVTNAANNDYLELSATGTAIALKKNGSAYLSQTDSAITSGQPGFQVGYNPGGANGNLELDNFTVMTNETAMPPNFQQAVNRGATF